MLCSLTPASVAFFNAATTSASLNTAPSPRTSPNSGSSSDGSNRTGVGAICAAGEEFFGDQRGAAIERGEIDGIEQPRPELALEAIVRQ